mgnify:CR=1 FL=1
MSTLLFFNVYFYTLEEALFFRDIILEFLFSSIFFLLKWNVLLICLTHRIFQIRFLITEKKNKFKK